ncbi:alkaline phosphatase D [Solimonas aquatica]|uniref:Alkaline phosphatase D n=1 Tax=Solimonas aquatica TaxID=489703 RepID=A0A1H9EN96_9GAMM|nr:alkaline phosphatase D family protein [Solimonas aquatica]SEQ27171.1 alkaline phosphatase D [Solimonas aquatica]
MPIDAKRRQLLLASAGLCGLGLLPALLANAREPSSKTYPFTLGVASGDPLPDGFVLWTRLAPQPLDDESGAGGMPALAVPVRWQVAEDEQFRKLVAQGSTLAEPQWGHSVHVEVRGLRADRRYCYRFFAMDAESPRGWTRSAPAAGMGRLRFALASCQHYEQGYYAAYRHLVREAPDLVLHVGDYIYESSREDGVRQHRVNNPQTLAQYRRHHAQYKLDADLQAAHAACPWLLTWDDHDVQNDYAGAHSQFNDPPERFLLRRAAAYQAYWEHLPLPLSARPHGPDMRLYRSRDYGELLRIYLPDDRQYRDDQACGSAGHWGGELLADCAQRVDPRRTMYGAAQEAWLQQRFAQSKARWNLLAQQLLMAPLDQQPGPGEVWWSDGWDGYPAARTRLLQSMRDTQLRNPLVLGGDIHSFWASELKADFADPQSPNIACEFTGTSISSLGGGYERYQALLPENPHIRFFDSRFRGYALGELSRDTLQMQFRALDDVRDADSGIRTLASFVVEAGQARIVAA